MFCFQCQETAGSTGCTVKGVCGKTDVVAAEQDLLVYSLKGLSWAADIAAEKGVIVGPKWAASSCTACSPPSPTPISIRLCSIP
jgi:hydroxylamine reductase (hybrid-cluster protein)